MNNEDQKLKNFLDKHDAGSKLKAHPNEWARISQEIENHDSWWLKKPIAVVVSAATILAIFIAINTQRSPQQLVISDEEVAAYLIETYSVVDNGFETSSDDYYTLLN